MIQIDRLTHIDHNTFTLDPTQWPSNQDQRPSLPSKGYCTHWNQHGPAYIDCRVSIELNKDLGKLSLIDRCPNGRLLISKQLSFESRWTPWLRRAFWAQLASAPWSPMQSIDSNSSFLSQPKSGPFSWDWTESSPSWNGNLHSHNDLDLEIQESKSCKSWLPNRVLQRPLHDKHWTPYRSRSLQRSQRRPRGLSIWAGSKTVVWGRVRKCDTVRVRLSRTLSTVARSLLSVVRHRVLSNFRSVVLRPPLTRASDWTLSTSSHGW